MKTTDHDLSRESIAGCQYLRARPVTRALAEIGVAAALVMPVPMALAAEAGVPILAREAARTTVAQSRAGGLLNDAKGVAVSTATKRQKVASYGIEFYDTYFSPNQRLVDQKSTLHLYFSNVGGQGYGSFDFDAKTLALPSGVVVASPVVTGNSCGGTLAPAAGATSIAFPAFTMTDDDTCYFGVEVTANTAGAKRLQPTFTGVFNDGGPSLVTVVSSDEATLSVTGAGVSFSPIIRLPGPVGDPHAHVRERQSLWRPECDRGPDRPGEPHGVRRSHLEQLLHHVGTLRGRGCPAGSGPVGGSRGKLHGFGQRFGVLGRKLPGAAAASGDVAERLLWLRAEL